MELKRRSSRDLSPKALHHKYRKYKVKYHLTKNLIVLSGSQSTPLKVWPRTTVSADMKRAIYDMYVKTYSQARQPIWFQDADTLMAVYDGFLLQIEDSMIMMGFAYYQYKTCKKLTINFHRGTDEDKVRLMDLKATLLVTPGYILEASGAVSHILKKYYRLRPHDDVATIKTFLDRGEEGYTNQKELEVDLKTLTSAEARRKVLDRINSTIFRLDDTESLRRFPFVTASDVYKEVTGAKGHDVHDGWYVRFSTVNEASGLPFVNVENLFGIVRATIPTPSKGTHGADACAGTCCLR